MSIGAQWLAVSFCVCLFCLGIFSPAHAVEFQPLGADRGLDAKIISSLLIDRHGFLWAASREGLYRYDGYRATRFTPDGEPGSITDADIRALHEAADGRIWVATNNGGLNAYDPETGIFSSYRQQSGDDASLSNDSVYGIADNGDGRLWVGTQIGLNRLDPDSGRVERYLHDPADPHSISNDYIFEIYRDSSGVVWITTIGGGLNRWNEQQQSFDRFDLAIAAGGSDGLNDIFAVAETADDVLWFGTRGGLVRLDAARESFQHIPIGEDAGAENAITQLIADEQGRLWISLLSGGVMVYQTSTGVSSPSNPHPLGSKGQLPALPQISLALAQDLLFVGTWGSGIYAGRISESQVSLLQVGAEINGLVFGNVTAVRAEKDDGRPWVGTLGGSLERADFVSNPVPAAVGETKKVSGGVLSLESLPGGRMFIGLTDGLLESVNETKTDIFHSHDAKIPDSLGPGHVTSLEADRDGGVWIGVGGSGLFHYSPGSEAFTSYAHDAEDSESLSGNYVTSLLQTDKDQLWVGTRSHGLNRCQMSPWRCERFMPDRQVPGSLGHFHVTSLLQDRDGRIWVTTDGGGLHRVEQGNEGQVVGFTRWTRRDGLVSNATMAILQDDDDTFWISSREGLSRLDPVTGRVANLVEAAGLPASAFNTNSADRDGRFLYFGTLSGLLSIPSGSDFSLRAPSPVGLTNIERPTEDGMGISLTAQPNTLSIQYGELISLGFAVLDFAEVPHEYEYRMDGSSQWIGLGTRQEITFSNLSPGTHEIRIRGRDVFGLWNEAAPFNIEVVPPFWMTDWFRLLALALITLLILAAHQARMSALQRRNRQLQALQVSREAALEQAKESHAQMEEAFAGIRNLAARLESAKEEERQILSRELHDELGQVLTAAKINLQMAKKAPEEPSAGKRLDDSVQMIDDMIRQVRDISLSLRPPLLDAAGLVPALEYYLGALEKRAAIPIEFTVEGVVSGNRPEVRTTVFRIIQEGVNNALRHSSASRIRVTLCSEGDSIRVTIQDDGCGFDPKAIIKRIRRGEHLGLLGMYERVHGAGGTFELDSKPGEGSVVRATVPA